MNNPDIYLRRRYCGVGDTCVNLIGHHKCVQDKTGAIMIGKSLNVSSAIIMKILLKTYSPSSWNLAA